MRVYNVRLKVAGNCTEVRTETAEQSENLQLKNKGLNRTICKNKFRQVAKISFISNSKSKYIDKIIYLCYI
jgi:hypothetical protein